MDKDPKISCTPDHCRGGHKTLEEYYGAHPKHRPDDVIAKPWPRAAVAEAVDVLSAVLDGHPSEMSAIRNARDALEEVRGWVLVFEAGAPNEPLGPKEDAPRRPGRVPLRLWAERLRVWAERLRVTSLGPTGERVCAEMDEWARRLGIEELEGLFQEKDQK